MSVRRIFNNSILKYLVKPDQKRLIYFLSFLVGLLSALAAAILKNSIFFTHRLITEGITPESRSYFYLFYPAIGMLLTILFVRHVVKDNIGHGVSRVLYAISRKRGRLKSHNSWTSIIATTLTIGFGGSVGAEAPIVLTGSSIGSTLGNYFRLNYRNVTLLIGCGAAGAIAGIFKAPIAGIVFTLEVLMLDLTISSIVPLMISSVTAATVAYFLVGEEVLFAVSVAGVFNIKNIPWYILLGIVTGLISVFFSKITLRVEGQYERIKNIYARLLVGGAVLALLIFVFPPFYGEGYDTIRELLKSRSFMVFENSPLATLGNSFTMYLLFFTGLVLFKAVATASTNGAGGVGGIFAPTLFLGGVTGLTVVNLLNHFGGLVIPENRFVLVGMAGAMAGVMHAPLTSIFLIAEITGGYVLLIPLIITSTISFITARAFDAHSLYHKELAERGELITHDKDKAVLTLMNWKNEIEKDLIKVRSDNSLGELVKAIAKSRRNIFPVVDQYNILEGVVLLDDVREVMFKNELYDKLKVKELMRIPPSYLDVRESLEAVMETFEKTEAWNLPVLDGGFYVGFISKSRIYSKYREQLLQFSEE